MPRITLIKLAFLFTISLVSCSHTSANNNGMENSLNFRAKTIDGSDFTGTSLMGKPVVLWFWAPWCPTCQREAPDIEAKVGAFPAISFIGVAARDSIAAMHQFADKYHLTFPQLADTDGLIWARFAIVRQPAFAFIHRNGHVEVTHGVINDSQFDEKLQTLAGENR